jgi:hypothetical protein
MQTTTDRARRFTARLGLESLESRTLLSTTLPAPTPSTTALVGQQATVSAIQVQSLATTANYSYSWSISPGPVLVAGGAGTGSVAIALSGPGSDASTVGGSASTISLGVANTSTSAVPTHQDVYNTTFSLTLHIKDANTGLTGSMTFQGKVTGSMDWTKSSLLLSFQNPMQKLTLGTRVFTVSLPSAVPLPIPGTPVKLSATVEVVEATASTSGQPAATKATYSYSMGVSPTTVLTGTNSTTVNRRSTGSVKLAMYRPGTATATIWGRAVGLPLAVVRSTSSASTTHPDHFNTPFAITLKIKDATSGITGRFTFKGIITGTLTSKTSTLTLTIQTPLTERLKIGARTYTVTLKTRSLHVPAPGGLPALLGATVQVK